jgi:polar amino acid transport system substrate-binding protein
MDTWMKRMTRRWNGARCAAGLLLGLAAGGGDAQTLEFVADPFPPFTYEENGTVGGPIADVVRATCELMRVPCELKLYPWRRAMGLVDQGLADGIFAVARIPEREKQFFLSDPIVESSYGVFVSNHSDLVYTSPRDLDGYTVAAYGPSAATEAIEQIAPHVPSMHMEVDIDNMTVLRKLQAMRYGDKGAAVINADVGLYMMRQEGINCLRMAGTIKKVAYSIGLSRKKVTEAQAEAFNSALRRLERSGALRRIVEGYGMKPGGAFVR